MSLPVFIISAHEQVDTLVDNSDAYRINRLYAAFTAKDSGVLQKDMVYDRAAFEGRLPGLLARSRETDNPVHARQRIDMACPTLMDVEYPDPSTDEGREDLIEIAQTFREWTGHSHCFGYYRLLPWRGPYWSERNYDRFWERNDERIEVVRHVDFCGFWCHPITRSAWEAGERWERQYRNHIKYALRICQELYHKRAYADITINYNPASPDRRNELVPIERFRWLLEELDMAGADGIIVDVSHGTASQLTESSEHWQVILDFMG